jgi:hypothetical protein
VDQVPVRTAPLPGRGAPRRADTTSGCPRAHPRSSSRAPLVVAGLAAAPPGSPRISPHLLAACRPLRHAGAASRPPLGLADALHWSAPGAHRWTELESLLPWIELVPRVPTPPPPMDDDDNEKVASSC